MSKSDEKIVNLNEDSKSHSHDDASFDKLMKQQEIAKQQLANKQGNK